MSAPQPRDDRKAGMGVDAHGGPVIDPTENVMNLVQAESRRQDNLREASERRLNDLRVSSDLRTKDMREERDKRFAEEALYQEKLAGLRDVMAAQLASHSRELLEKESRRLDAIRQVDQQQITTAAQQTLTAVNTLAATNARDAETLRNALTNTATTIAAQQQAIVAGLSERISALEKTSYVGAGKEAYVDPMMTRMVAGLEELSRLVASGRGKSDGINASWSVLIGAATLIVALLVIGSFVYLGRPAAVAAPPQVIYAVPPR